MRFGLPLSRTAGEGAERSEAGEGLAPPWNQVPRPQARKLSFLKPGFP